MRVPVHGAVIGEPEKQALREVVERGWFTAGPACAEFASKLRKYTGQREVVLCNSGSSANLLAITALTQPELGDRAIQPGDEVITTALGFPTTLNPILQIGATPVFIDVDLPGMVPNPDRVAAAITKRTKAVVLAHTLGYPLQSRQIATICRDHGLWFVEDCCDALGSSGIMEHADLSTLSFYPAHQICAGEGGAVLTQSPKVGKILRSLRDWGKDCWCDPGEDNHCGRRFDNGGDHKYTFSRVGYHLAMTDFQGALGAAQMDRLPGFVHDRVINHAALLERCYRAGLDQYFILPDKMKDASWFGFSLICQPPIRRNAITAYLEDHGIQTRRMFGGNLLRQPAYANVDVIVSEPLLNTDLVDSCGFWVGCWPGLSTDQLDYIVSTLVEYVEGV